MTRKTLILAALIPLFFFGGCKGGGGDSGGTVTEELQTAQTQLKSGDIASARATYSSIIGDWVAARVTKSPDDPTNAEARFGRAFCDMMLVIEQSSFTSILAGFGQPAWSTTSVFGAGGYLALSLTDPTSIMSSLPFNNTKSCWEGSTYHHEYKCVLTHVTDGYTMESAASSLNGLSSYIDHIIQDLLVAIDDPAAHYTIPKELYSGDADIPVNHADMVMMLSGMYGLLAASDFANSWRFNLDLSDLVDSTGAALITIDELISRLNNQFGLRSDNRLANAKANLQSMVTYSITALQEILAGSSGGTLNLSTENGPIYTELLDMMNSTNASFGAAAAIDQFLPIIEVNLNSFFNNPADGSVPASDPFVNQGGHIKGVEAYWQEMINTACNYTIGTQYKIFSDAVRAISQPYYKLFNTIMGHRFGKYQAGT